MFIDHLDRSDPSKYKLGEKLSARIVSVDAGNQHITLSLLPHLVSLTNVSRSLLEEGVTVGKVYEQVHVNNVTYGESYKIGLT